MTRRTLPLLMSLALLSLAAGSAPAWAGGSASLQVSAVILSRSNCFFNPPTSAVLDFGNLDPRNTTDAPALTSTLTFKCAGSAAVATYALSHNTGLHGDASGARMKHETANEYLPYSLALSPASGTVNRNVNVTVTVTGTVRAADYRNARAGRYADTVILTVTP
ncbi:MAG TPA: spore coat protein U domain-containing protein [Burkholderiales bacterium]